MTYDAMTDEQKDDLAGRVPLDDINQEITTLTNALDGEVTRALAAEADLQTQIDETKAVNASQQTEIEKLQELTLEQITSYGIEFDTTISDPACTRIGNRALHKTLPVQSLMKGCLLDDDGNVVEYLPEDDWTSATRDGSKGQVMVEIPSHWRKCVTDGTKRQVWLSLLPLEGYHEVPRMYVSAYQATVQRSTSKLCSVVNEDADYRGGNNNTNYDGTYRTFLGRPATVISRTDFRRYARNRNAAATAEWNCMTYDAQKTIYWLFAVEYATLNTQAAYNAEMTSDGFRQGGLGAGVTHWEASEWSTFNGLFPFAPCGHTDTLGNETGVVPYTAYNEDGSELKTSSIPRYHGVENPFGHIWQWTDGINVRISPNVANGGDGLSKVFVCSDPSMFNGSNYEGYSHVGNEARTDGYVKEAIFGEGGEIMPSVVGGGSTQFFCDNHYTNIPTTEALRGVLFGGSASGGANAGLASARSFHTPSGTNANFGSRLTFIPNKNS